MFAAGAACLFSGGQSWRSRDHASMQGAAAVALFVAAGWMFATPFIPWLQRQKPSMVRIAFVSSAFTLRGLALIISGSERIDRTAELLAAGNAIAFAVIVVLMRMQYEAAVVAGLHARD